MKNKKIKIVYEEIEVTEYYVVKSFSYDRFEPKIRFKNRENKRVN